MKNLMRYSSISLLVISGCGAIDMPDSGLGGTPKPSTSKTDPTPVPSKDGLPVQGSSEAEFDLAKCGFDLTKPSAVFASRRMSMPPKTVSIKQSILGGIFTTQTNVSVAAISITEDSLSRTVSTFSAQGSPQVDSPEMTAILTKYAAGFAADIMAPDLRAKIGTTNADWKGIFCSYQPAVKIERGSTSKITAELDKPMPISPVVSADLARLKSEIGVNRTWNAITAKVVDSSDTSVAVGTTWTGKVTSQPVAASVTVDGVGGKVTVKSELAVKMTYDFGSNAANKALGLPKTVTWYLDTAVKGYRLMQVDFGDGDIVNYFPNQ